MELLKWLNRFLYNASIIIAEGMPLRYDILDAKYNGFLNLEIEGDFKGVINCYNKKSSFHSLVILLINDIWSLS